MKARCPLCGHKTLARGDGWDGDTLRIGGHEIRMTVMESNVLRVLAEAGGRWVTRESLITALWAGAREPDSAENSLSVYVCQLRKKLYGTGIRIGSSSKAGRGCRTMYRLESTEEP